MQDIGIYIESNRGVGKFQTEDITKIYGTVFAGIVSDRKACTGLSNAVIINTRVKYASVFRYFRGAKTGKGGVAAPSLLH